MVFRYCNVDFIVLAALIGVTLLRIVLTYDIACQWLKNFRKRMEEFPPDMQILDATKCDVAVPGWHINGHCESCRNKRSYQCPPYSCWIPVIPVDSGGIPVEFTSQNFTPATKLCNSGIYTGMVPGVQSPEWHRNPVTGIEIKNSKYGNFCIFT